MPARDLSPGRPLATVLATTAVAALIGATYLYVAPRQYTAVAKVSVERAAPAATQAASGVSDALLEAQADVVRSSEVLRLADANGGLGTLPSFAGRRDPLPAIRRGLKVESSDDGRVLTVAYRSTEASDAARVIDAIVSSFISYHADRRERSAAEGMAAARDLRQPLAEEYARASRAAAEAASRVGVDTTESLEQRVRTLADQLAQAQLRTTASRRIYDEAVADAGPLLSRLSDDQLDRTVRAAGAEPLDSPENLTDRLTIALRQLTELKRSYAENHPAVARARAQIEQLRLDRVAAVRERWQGDLAREQSIGQALDRAQTDAAAAAGRVAERDERRADAERIRMRLDAADREIDRALATSAGTPLRVEAITPADAEHPDYPATPRPVPTLIFSVLAGLVAGGVLAASREYRRAGTLRHVAPTRAGKTPEATLAREAFGHRVLGTFPEIAPNSEADQAAGLRRAVAATEFPASSAAACLVALEAEDSATGVVAITSAVAGQGRTSIARALAQQAARDRPVLLIDASASRSDDGPEGFIDVVADGTLEGRVGSADRDGVRRLGPGRSRADASQLLNSPRLADAFDACRSAYGLVVVDCPSLDAGDDARVIAAIADNTIVVADGSVTALRRAATARDVLRLVGANVVGIVINRVRPGGDASENESSLGSSMS